MRLFGEVDAGLGRRPRLVKRADRRCGSVKVRLQSSRNFRVFVLCCREAELFVLFRVFLLSTRGMFFCLVSMGSCPEGGPQLEENAPPIAARIRRSNSLTSPRQI